MDIAILSVSCGLFRYSKQELSLFLGINEEVSWQLIHTPKFPILQKPKRPVWGKSPLPIRVNIGQGEPQLIPNLNQR